MKSHWSAYLSLLLLLALMGCSKENFGTAGQSTQDQAPQRSALNYQACTNHTLIKPKVDVVYVVDNSASTYFLSNDIKNTLRATVDSLSQQFDFRVVGTPLISTNNEEYQVMTNSPNPSGLPLPNDPRRIGSSNQFTFFENPSGGGFERGLSRVYNFVNAHAGGLLRKEAYTLVVLISNGRDNDVEQMSNFGNGEVVYNATAFNNLRNQLLGLKAANRLDPLQFRLLTATAHTNCQSGWFSSQRSYVAMSRALYEVSGASDQQGSATPDAYNLCSGGISSIFSSVNNAIKQVIVPHHYRYWPITFLNNNEQVVSVSDLQVRRISPSGSEVTLQRNVDWQYEDRGTTVSVNTRELPTSGEPVSGRHFVRFTNLLSYPDCVVVSSQTKEEYFGYLVMDRRPIPSSIQVIINGVTIPSSGWTYMGDSQITRNIKVPYPSAGDENPPVMRTGFMIQLNGPQYYYKSGQSAQVLFAPAPF